MLVNLWGAYFIGSFILYIIFSGGSRIGTVELQHPLFKIDIIDNI